MNALKNKVQLIGNAGNDPEIKIFEAGKKKLARLVIATNYDDKNGEKRYITEVVVSDVLLFGK